MNNLCEGIGKIKYKYGSDDKKCESIAVVFLSTQVLKMI